MSDAKTRPNDASVDEFLEAGLECRDPCVAVVGLPRFELRTARVRGS